jgi:aldehyde dehydrogenase (NAD+)
MTPSVTPTSGCTPVPVATAADDGHPLSGLPESGGAGGGSASHPLPGIEAIPRRVAWAARFRALLVEHEPALTDAIRTDIHKEPWETLTQEFMPTLAAIRWHERNAPRLLRTRRVRGAPWWALGQRHVAVQRPVGRVLIIATWNYPLQLLAVQMVQAVLAGNRVVVKPSERAPRSQRLIVELARRALVETGSAREIIASTEATRAAGRDVLERERFDHVVFTGSTEVGRQIAAACARTLTPTTLELSGRDSAIVLADAPLELAARTLWHALAMNAGQTCMAPRRILVEEAAYRGFLAHLRPLAAAARPVRLADAAMAERCAELVRSAVAAGGRPLSGVVEDAAGGALRPQAVVDGPRDHPLVEGRLFGPVVAVLPVRDLADAVAIHRASGQFLAASVFTARPERVLGTPELLDALGAGVVTINDGIVPTGHPAVSIEGRGESGWGASRGAAGLLALSRTVHVSTTSLRVRLPLGEPTAQAMAWVRRLVLGSRGGDGRIAHRRPGAAPDGGATPSKSPIEGAST